MIVSIEFDTLSGQGQGGVSVITAALETETGEGEHRYLQYAKREDGGYEQIF